MKFGIEPQQLGNRVARWSFFFLYGLVRVLPISLFRKTANPFLHVFIRFAIPRQRVIRNLSEAFGASYSAATKDGLAKGIQEHFFETSSIACCSMPTSTRDENRPHRRQRNTLSQRSAKAKASWPSEHTLAIFWLNRMSKRMERVRRVELPTLCLASIRSSQLSYTRMLISSTATDKRCQFQA